MLLTTLIISGCYIAIKVLCGPFGPKKKGRRIFLLILAVVLSSVLIYDCMFGKTTEEFKVMQLGDNRPALTLRSSVRFLGLEDYNNNIYWGLSPVAIINTKEPVQITYLKLSKYAYQVYAYDDFYNGYREVYDHHIGFFLYGGFIYIFAAFMLWNDLKKSSLFRKK